jgi:hypothetical protein
VSIIGGLDVHRRQVTFDWVDRGSGEAPGVGSRRRPGWRCALGWANCPAPRARCGGGMHRRAVCGRGAPGGRYRAPRGRASIAAPPVTRWWPATPPTTTWMRASTWPTGRPRTRFAAMSRSPMPTSTRGRFWHRRPQRHRGRPQREPRRRELRDPVLQRWRRQPSLRQRDLQQRGPWHRQPEQTLWLIPNHEPPIQHTASTSAVTAHPPPSDARRHGRTPRRPRTPVDRRTRVPARAAGSTPHRHRAAPRRGRSQRTRPPRSPTQLSSSPKNCRCGLPQRPNAASRPSSVQNVRS